MDKLLEVYGLDVVPDNALQFAVVFARFNNQWMISRQRRKDTWEVQGGHRDPGEEIEYTAARELYEESGAERFRITPMTDYTIMKNGSRSYGRLFYAEVYKLNELPAEFEIEEVQFVETFPENMTYIEVHKLLYKIITNHDIDNNVKWYNYEIKNGRILVE